MEPCAMCKEQAKKSRSSKPHAALVRLDEPRVFMGSRPRGYEEQDYQCQTCSAKFTHSTDKNGQAWTLWQG